MPHGHHQRPAAIYTTPHAHAPSSRNRNKKRNPLQNWPRWYEPSINSSISEWYSIDTFATAEDTSFGEILDRILSFTDWWCMAKLRRVSHQFKRHVDAFQLRHVVLRTARPRPSDTDASNNPHRHIDVVVRGLNGRVIPAIKRVRLTSSAGSIAMHQAEARLFDMMSRHTRVVDLVGGFDEYALGCLSFGNLEYLRIIPFDGNYVSSFPFPARNIVLFMAQLPPTPPRGREPARMIVRPTTKVVIVQDAEVPFEPNKYWPALTRAHSHQHNIGHSLGHNHAHHSHGHARFHSYGGYGAHGHGHGHHHGHGSTIGHLVIIFQPEAKSTARGRMGFSGNFWANAFALEQFDEEWLTVRKAPMAINVALVTVMAAEQPHWAITVVGLKPASNNPFASSGNRTMTAAAYLLAGRKDNRMLLDSIKVRTMTEYAAALGSDHHLLLETMTAF